MKDLIEVLEIIKKTREDHSSKCQCKIDCMMVMRYSNDESIRDMIVLVDQIIGD